MRFTSPITDEKTEESVLCEIECEYETVIFATLENESAHPEEEEVLFDLGATFQVVSVIDSQEETNFNLRIVTLKSIQDGKKAAQEFLTSMKHDTFEDRLFAEVNRGRLIYQMGQSDKSLKYFEKLMSIRPANVSAEDIHGAMVGPLISLGRLDEALEHQKLRQKTRQLCYRHFS
jgi:tetratricopeptide (TPR) repeat protein